jgi:hypothetical protein
MLQRNLRHFRGAIVASQPEIEIGSAAHVLSELEIGSNFIDQIDGLLARLRARLAQYATQYYSDVLGLPLHGLEELAAANLDVTSSGFMEFYKEFIPELIAAAGTKIIHRYGGEWKLVREPIFGQHEPWIRDAKDMWYPVFCMANLYNEVEEGISVEAMIYNIISSRQAASPELKSMA